MNEIFDWEQVPEQPPSPPAPPPPPLSEDDCSIFPPSNHEGLHVQGFRSFNPPHPEGNAPDWRLQLSVSRLRVAGESAKQRLLLGFQSLYSKLLLLRFNSPSFSSGRVVWAFPAATATTGVGVVLFLWWLRRRRAAPAEKDETVLLLIRENQKVCLFLCVYMFLQCQFECLYMIFFYFLMREAI